MNSMPDDYLSSFDISELTASVYQSWRLEQEERPLSLRTSITGALNKMPAPWIGGIAQSLSIRERHKKQRIKEIARALTDPFSLAHIVEGLPTLPRRVIKTVLDRGGWAEYAAVVRTFGADDSAWFWEEQRPQSPLGLARVYGLLMVGTAVVDGTMLKVVVIPHEIREALEKILAREESVDLEAPTSTTDLAHVLADVDDYYADPELEFEPAFDIEDVQGYLSDLANSDPQHLIDAWMNIQLISLYIRILDKSNSLDQLDDYHISEFVHQFMDNIVVDRVDVVQRRNMLATFDSFMVYLHKQHKIRESTLHRVQRAINVLLKPKRKLGVIDRPAPCGGEPILAVKEKRESITYTLNDLWLILVALAEYEGDLQALHKATTGIPDATIKRKRIEWLLKRDLDPLYDYAEYIPVDSYGYASEWFKHRSFNHTNAWLPPLE